MTSKLTYGARSEKASEQPLKAYLLHLMSVKKSNLCVSADVHTTHQLLRLAEDVGDHICVLKTHADLVDDFSDRAIKGLKEISRRKKFLIFEDRKFGDIGNTLKAQYVRGPQSIASWAHLVNAYVLLGESVITCLEDGATAAINSLRHGVATEIFVGTPNLSEDEDEDEPAPPVKEKVEKASDDDNAIDDSTISPEEEERARTFNLSMKKKGSVVRTTSIIQTIETEYRPGARGSGDASLSPTSINDETIEMLDAPPLDRGLLLFAQTSNADSYFSPEYTATCVKLARKHKKFVLGFISQEDLNTDSPADDFISFTPGVNLPQEGEDEEKRLKGDGLGQQYRTPDEMVGKRGCDIVIVGRGIISAKDRKAEAERYQREAWKAYKARLTG